jgi:hypothetical protein
VVSLPAYWDAAAVYAPGAKWLLDHGFDARPGVFPADLGRGHPSLYYLVLAGAFRVFGASPVVGQLGSCLASVATLVLVIATGARLGSLLAGVLAALLLLGSPLYLSMSVQMLPELPMTALTMGCLLAYLHGRMWIVAGCGCVLVLFKETGIAGPLAIGGALLHETLRQGNLGARLPALALAAAPAVALGGFFLWQLHGEGWIVMPYHQELFHDRIFRLENTWECVASMTASDGRSIALAAAALGGIAWLVRGGRAEPIAVGVRGAGTSDLGRFFLAASLLALAFIGFFSKMFWLRRYGLPAHPGICLMITLLLAKGAEAVLPGIRGALLAAAPVLAALVVGLSARGSGTEVASGETTFRYTQLVAGRRAIYGELERLGGDPFVLTAWPMEDELRSPWLGWVSRPFRVLSLEGRRRRGSAAPRPDAIVIQSGCCSEAELRAEAARRGMRLAYRVEVAGAPVELWTLTGGGK